MDRQDTILILHAYKNRNRVMADDFEKAGDKEAARRYRHMAEWFADAIRREEELDKKEKMDT